MWTWKVIAMATVNYNVARDDTDAGPNLNNGSAPCRPLHRISTVRQQEGMSLRSVARQLGTEVRRVKAQEEETADLCLTDLYNWQQVLDVPVAELLVDPDTPLSRPVMERARLVRLMKTAAAILERSRSTSVRRMAQRMVDQLIDVMPELKNVGPWISVGQRRGRDDFGRVVERLMSEDSLYDRHQD